MGTTFYQLVGSEADILVTLWRWQFGSVSNTCVEQLNGLITPGQLQPNRKKPGTIPACFFVKLLNGYQRVLFSACGQML